MAKDEMMELGRLIVQSELDALYIKDIRIMESANEHGRMNIRFLSRKKLTSEDTLRYQDTPIQVLTMDGETVFSGVCRSIGLEQGNDYAEVLVTAYTNSVLTDVEERTNTFQTESKNLSDVLKKGIGRKAQVTVDQDVEISEMLSQEQETDWAFDRRIANQYQKQLFVNSKSAGCQIHVGPLPFQVAELGMAEPVSVGRDVDAVRDIQGNSVPNASVYEFEKTVLRTCDLSIGAGYAVVYRGRQQIVTKSEIAAGQGVVWNVITLSSPEGSVPARTQTSGSVGRNSVLTGEVLAVEGNMVQVDFHTPGDAPRWIPYASSSSNYFYSMPDEHDTVYVYYETGASDRLVCLGSKHVKDSPDFGNYQDKMLTANNRMIKFSSAEVSLVGSRKEYDGEGGDQAKIVFNDETGIEIYSTQDINLETTDEGNITIQAAKDSYAGLEKVKEGFTQAYAQGEETYKADGGNTDFNALELLAKANMEHVKENVKNNLLAPFQVVNTVQEFGGRFTGEKGIQKTSEGEDAPPEFEDGVVNLLSLERMVIQVGSSYIIFGDGLIQIKSNAYLQLGTDRSITYEHLELENYTWRDMALDLTECALDIIGVLPIPGVSTVANLAKMGISLAKGDYVGAAIDAAQATLSLIPGGNTVGAPLAAAETASKASKAMQAVNAVIAVVKTLSTGAQILDLTLNVTMSAWDIGEALKNGEFDLNDPACRQDLAMLFRGATELGKSKIESNNKKKQMEKERCEREAEQGSGNSSRKKSAEGETVKNSVLGDESRKKLSENSDNCKKGNDPVDMITGSYLVEQCDFIINDITGRFAVERTYQSLLCTEDSPVGKGWTLNLFSRAVVYDDRVEIILPDNHTETFLKTAEGYRNRRGGAKKLTLEEDGSGYRMREAGTGLVRAYDHDGKLLLVTDRNGNGTAYHYSKDTLEEILFASGQYLKLFWQGDKLISMEDCIGRTVRYHYENGLLTEVEMVNGGVEKYAYDSVGRISDITNANGITYVHNEYDFKNRVTRQRLSNGQEYALLYADEDRVNTNITLSNQKAVRYVYNKDRNPIRTEYPDGTTEETAYDVWENRILEKDRLGNEIHRTFDEYGNLLEERLPNGLVTSYEYDEQGNCVHLWDNEGRSSRYEYDEKGNLVKEIQQIDDSRTREVAYEYDKYGRLVSFTDGNGNQERYGYSGRFFEAESFTTAEGSHYNYRLDPAGRCVEVTDASGTSSYAYNHFDLMSMETNPLGHASRYVYDRVLDLVSLVRPNQQASGMAGEVYAYDAFHNLLSRTDETGAVFATPRDGEGNILKEINPNFYHPGTKDGTGIEHLYDADDNRYLSIYPDGGRQRRWHDASGNLIRVCLPEQYDEKADDGSGYSYEYDAMNRLTQVTGPDGNVKKRYVYDLHGNIRKMIDARGMETGETDEERIGSLYAYNYAGWLIESRIPVKLEEGKAFYQVVRFRYDKAGNRTEEKHYLDYQTRESLSGAVRTIHYEYDREDRITRVSDSTGAMLEYAYDAQGRRVFESRKISDAVSQVMRYRYDAGGRLVEESRTADREGSGKRTASTCYAYDRNGNVTRIILPSKAEILRKYDPADRLIKETHVDKQGGIHNTTVFSYDKAGNIICITDNQGRETRLEYDPMNREIRRIEKDGAVTRQIYDRNGQLSKVIRPNEYQAHGDAGAGFVYTYDEEGRILTVIRPDGVIAESNTYDEEGRLIRTADAAGSGAGFTYDFGGRRTRVRTTGQASQEYEYDALGNIIGIKDGEGNRTGYALDAWGRITEIEKADGSSEYYGYDYAGNIIRSVDGEGNTTEYEYNGINRIASVTDPLGGKETYAYDLEERLCRKTDRNGIESRYTYNLYGNLLLKRAGELSEAYEYTPEGLLRSAVSGGMRYNYAYDVMGRLTGKSASGRKLLALDYDLNGNMIRQTDVTGKVTEYRYDLMDQLLQVLDDGKSMAEYAYYPDGLVKSLKNGESLYTEYAYDNDKNLSFLKTRLGSETLAENHYRYDGNGSRTEKRQMNGTTLYHYDSQNRLRMAEYPGRTEELFYDRAGNRTRRLVNGREELYRYDKRNRLTEHIMDGETERFAYDDAGNLVEDSRARYEYDAFNRMTKTETFNGNVQINRYDPEGLRHEMEENGELVHFIFRDREVIAEEKEKGDIRYIRGRELLASDAERARIYYHYASDEMGSVTHVTAKDEVLNRYEYDAWGNALTCEEQVENRFRFAGEQYDPVSQQYYLRARFYNPVIGRFTQEDSYRGDGLNLYAYCQNNPVYYVDPTGNRVCPKEAKRIREAINNRTASKDDIKKISGHLREKATDRENGKHVRFSKAEKQLADALGIDLSKGSPKRQNEQRSIWQRYTGKQATGEVHHGFSEEYKEWFGERGIDVNDPRYFYDLPTGKHRFKNSNGIHTTNSPLGGEWNAEWSKFITQNKDTTVGRMQIIGKLKEMERKAGIEKYRAVKKE